VTKPKAAKSATRRRRLEQSRCDEKREHGAADRPDPPRRLEQDGRNDEMRGRALEERVIDRGELSA